MAALPTAGSPPASKGNEPASGSSAERALLERLQERRKELEARARDLEMRESLIKAAEKQLDSKIGEMKGGDGKDAEAPERIKSLVVMYESMGPKEAARIFDRLDARTLVELVNQMNPRKVSEIMAKMQPEAAERMTLELARGRGQSERALPASDLRRIAPKGR
jgi:flagellar motility protein MotE (MotC chaperone)